jgi:starvation-inducible DNA-binding protein
MENGILERERTVKTKRTHKKLGYSTREAAEIIGSMNILIANYSVHYQKLRNFHWNVKGADFFDIHEKFEDQYNEAKVAIDDLAERVRVFGSTPLSTMKEYLEISDIKESGTDLQSMEMVKEILNDYKILLEHLFSLVEISLEHGDSGTEDLAKGIIKKLEKHHWMMTAFTHGS